MLLDIEISNKEQSKSDVYYIFQNTPVVKNAPRLVIDPGYLFMERIGSTTSISIKEYPEEQNIENACIDLIIENPDIISISGLKITAKQPGKTILIVKQNTLSDTIQVIVKGA